MENPIILSNSKELERLCSVLKIIANPNRLRILVLLLDGEFSVGEIEAMLSIKQPTLSQELRNLRDSGLVKTRRESKVIFYSVSEQATETPIRSLIKSLFPNDVVSNFVSSGPVTDKVKRTGECGHFPTVNIAQ